MLSVCLRVYLSASISYSPSQQRLAGKSKPLKEMFMLKVLRSIWCREAGLVMSNFTLIFICKKSNILECINL